MRILLSLTAAFVLAVLSIASGLSVHAASPAQPVALKLSDLPSGFRNDHSAEVSNAAFSKQTGVPKAQFDSHGRIDGYDAAYARNVSKGLVYIASNVYLYKTSAGAHWDYTHSVAHALTQAKKAAAPRFGTESAGLVLNTKVGKQTVVTYFIFFHKANYDITVGASAVKGQVKMADAAHYAQIVQARIH